MKDQPPYNNLPFLAGGGAMGEQIRNKDWALTPIGEPDSWHPTLKQTVSLMLDNPFPMLICWGADYIQLYNDAFRPINGETKHPQALGGSANETYAEIWKTIGPMFAGVMHGQPVGFPNFMVPLNRNGYLEECYFDFSYSPIKDLYGNIHGVLVVCVETTDKVRALDNLNINQKNIQNMIRQAPVGICMISGKDLIIEQVNDLFLEIVRKERETFFGPYWDALPEARNFYEPLTDHVMQTRETHRAKEDEVVLIRKGVPETVYVDFVYEPLRDNDGNVTAIMIVVTEVTDKVLARKALQEINNEIAASNEEMAASNEELTVTNEELAAAQKQAEYLLNSIKDNEAKLDQVIDILPASIVILLGEDFVIEQTNPTNLAYWQKTREQVIGKPLLEALPELADQAFPGQLKQVLDEGITIFETEHLVRLEGADGSVNFTYVDYSYQPLTDKDGKRIGVLVMSNDVTERRLRQDELAQARLEALQQRNRLTEFFMEAPAGICILSGPDLIFEMVNPLYQQIFPGRDVLGKKMLEALPEVDGTPIWDILQNVVRTGKTFEGHELLIPLAWTDDGQLEERYFDFIYQARLNEDGQPDGILVFVIDVTEQVRTKQKIVQAEENLRMAIQAGDMGTFSINTTTLDLYTSPRVRELYGFSPDKDLTLEVIMAQIREDYRSNVATMVEGAIDRGERFELEYPVMTHDEGKERWFKAVGSTVVNTTNKDNYFTGTIIDITERRADDQRKNDFIGMVSHELKTPLTTLNAIVQVANAKLKNSPDTFLAGAMQKAQVQVKKMSKMINGFLNVSRLESGKISIEKEEFGLDGLIDEIIQETALTVKDHTIHFDNCNNVIVNADKEKIGSVISNLLSNGIKYSPGSKLLDVRCHVKNNNAIVSVQDYGMGVKRHDREKLFDRYYRVESNTNQHISGFGIGLYLSAEIIRRHDGEIWVDSEYGQGSTFYFSLPL